MERLVGPDPTGSGGAAFSSLLEACENTMAARFQTVVALRLPEDVARVLKERARDHDGFLRSYLRRILVAAPSEQR